MIIHRKKGDGVLNTLINKLPFELHIPGYQYCGPGTKLAKRIARGDPGINPLDAACKEHDIAYSQNRENIAARNAADKVLAEKAWQRVKSKDARFGEKASAYAITNIMKLKSKLGMGAKKKKITFNKIVKRASTSMVPSKYAKKAILSALKGARKTVKDAGGKRNVIVPRIVPVPAKVGGFLPFLIPLFAGLSATGALAGGAAGIAKAVNDAKAAKQQLEENTRHNKAMEALALGKGLFLKPHKTGLGLHLKTCTGAGLKKKRSTKKRTTRKRLIRKRPAKNRSIKKRSRRSKRSSK
jgi:hypothetical protein